VDTGARLYIAMPRLLRQFTLHLFRKVMLDYAVFFISGSAAQHELWLPRSRGFLITHPTVGDYAVPYYLTLSLLMSYMYGAPCTARNFNVLYILTYVWQH
jgi:hypothetical protein